MTPFQNPNFGLSGEDDYRLIWQAPLRPDEAGQWGAPMQFEGDLFAGHAALRNRCHAGYRHSCVTPPDPDGNLDRWLIGVDPVSGTRVGPILALGPHQIDSSGNIKDDDAYADGRLVVADAAAGWDTHGLWVSGRIRPEATEHQKAALYGSALSGEWLPSPLGGLELVAMLAVNAPGYVVRRLAASNATAEIVRTVGPVCCPDEPVLEVTEAWNTITSTVGPVCCPDEPVLEVVTTALGAALLYGIDE